MHNYISGIQQIGIGVKDAKSSLHEYAKLFGMNTLVFNDISEASLMTRYTGGKAYNRQALLSMNLQGGGGFEIWQFLDREPEEASSPIHFGDLGIFAPKIKCRNMQDAFAFFTAAGKQKVSALQADGRGNKHFWLEDANSNLFNVVCGNHWFQHSAKTTGGVSGAVIGVSNMDASIKFYQTLLQRCEVVYDKIETCKNAFASSPGKYRRVLLETHPVGKGAFGKLLGSVELELVQSLDREPVKIYHNRFWGDCGYIHICFDVFDMCGLKKHMEESGYSFTVDSVNSFEMENAAGRFCYVEDPDGTLIELVETHKIPIIKKAGIYLNLKKRNLEKPLPDWMIKLLSLSKVK